MFRKLFSKKAQASAQTQAQTRWELAYEVDAYNMPISTYKVIYIKAEGNRQVVAEFDSYQAAWDELKRIAW